MKVNGPMFSLEASGSIGGAITAARWKGRPYFRIKVKPSNPKSAGQTSNRAVMKCLSQAWGQNITIIQTDWDALAASKNVSPFNAFVGFNMSYWTNFLPPSLEAIADRSAYTNPVVTIVPAAGVKSATVVVTMTTDSMIGGVALFAKVGSGPTGVKSEVIQMQSREIDSFTFQVNGLTSGDVVHFKARAFSRVGGWGALSADSNVTID